MVQVGRHNLTLAGGSGTVGRREGGGTGLGIPETLGFIVLSNVYVNFISSPGDEPILCG